MKYLFGLADTEGAPHRKNTKSNLWDIAIVFKYVFQGEPPWDTLEEVYHVCQFSCSKWSTRESIGPPLASFQNSIRHLLNHHGCERLCLCFWNAPHDRAVLKKIGVTRVYTLDLMQAVGKSKLGGPHFALGDVHKMLEFNMHPCSIIENTKPPLLLDHETTKRRVGRTGNRDKKETDDADITDLTKNFTSLAIAFAKGRGKTSGKGRRTNGGNGECDAETSRPEPVLGRESKTLTK